MKRWQILFSIILEILIFLCSAALLIIAVPKLLGFLWPFVASWILALLASPVCCFLEKHIRLNKKWSSAIIIILVLVGLAFIGYFIVTKLGKELISFLSYAPTYYSYFQNIIKELGTNLNNIIMPISPDFGQQIQMVFDDLLSQMGKAINDFAPKTVEIMGSAATNLTNGLIGTLVMILSAYFFIADKEKITENIYKLLPDSVKETVLDVKNKLMEALGGFILAQFKIMCIILLILLVGFLVIHNPYALLLAFLIAFLDLLPVLGTGTILIPWALITLIRGEFQQGVILIILYLVCLLTRQLLQPKIIGDSVGLGTLPTLFLIYVGYKLQGMRGMILALLIGVVVVTLYRLGLFDNKIKRMNYLIDQYRHFDE